MLEQSGDPDWSKAERHGQMPGRQFSAEEYRYGFNGMEKDDEFKGEGNSYDFGARMYDARIGRWLSRDAHEIKYKSQSPYSFVNNTPVIAVDPDGNDAIVLIWMPTEGDQGHSAIAIQDYDKVTGEALNTYTLYHVFAVAGSINPITALLDPEKVVDGYVTKQEGLTLNALKNVVSGDSRADVLYKINSGQTDDEFAVAQIEPMIAETVKKDNPHFDPRGEPTNNDQYIFEDEFYIPYAIIDGGDCNKLSCAGLVSLILSDAYGLFDFGLEQIDFMQKNGVGRHFEATTPNMLNNDLRNESYYTDSKVEPITSPMPNVDFVNAFSGNDIKDTTPNE
jgi:RHS repeat-associated protein